MSKLGRKRILLDLILVVINVVKENLCEATWELAQFDGLNFIKSWHLKSIIISLDWFKDFKFRSMDQKFTNQVNLFSLF